MTTLTNQLSGKKTQYAGVSCSFKELKNYLARCLDPNDLVIVNLPVFNDFFFNNVKGHDQAEAWCHVSIEPSGTVSGVFWIRFSCHTNVVQDFNGSET